MIAHICEKNESFVCALCQVPGNTCQKTWPMPGTRKHMSMSLSRWKIIRQLSNSMHAILCMYIYLYISINIPICICLSIHLSIYIQSDIREKKKVALNLQSSLWALGSHRQGFEIWICHLLGVKLWASYLNYLKN